MKEWIKKIWYIYTKPQKEQNYAVVSDMDGPRDCHTECSKLDRKKNIIWYCLYVEYKKQWYKWTCLQNRNWITYVENNGYQGGNWGRGKLRLTGINISPLLYIK